MNPIISSIDTILVPQGAEYKAVCRGIYPFPSHLQIRQIPAGIKPLSRYLQDWGQSQNFLDKRPRGIMVMGLGGSLSPKYGVGDGVLYGECGYFKEEKVREWQHFDQELIELVLHQLGDKISWVRGISSDRLIGLGTQKYLLGKEYQVDVVDMEGIGVLEFCKHSNIPVVMVRVISDNCEQNLPDLTPAFNENGTLNNFILARQMLKNPLSSLDLIRSSLQGLKRLEQVARDLFMTVD
ncbi:5'-methylthioadenosine/S-adenosylhomocysteine nucleosidase family protein [Aphanothece sacrum]|uniref:Nucleoside phosphorylase n=1 Tax=Aphanothece sacrum FPU1 TaxID=1920663 RepID=A0A401IET9_APHSA|nr:hypothetical protein [Aphanothece sacrum]GBF79783.1 nucleoside phosphorylase [Aphanothece sacrum FPU1]GBF84795.1 nucleoside phosphorylase [Aphanothece sacrum FPU3]